MGTGAGTLKKSANGYDKMPEGGDPKMKSRLTHKDSAVRDEAAKELGNLGAAGAAHIDDLTTALLDPDIAGVRKSAAIALSKMGPDGARALNSQLGNESVWVREICAWGLGKMGQEASPYKGALAARCGTADPEAQVRREAAKAIGAIGPNVSDALVDQQVCEALGVQLNDENDMAAQAAALTLSVMGTAGGAKLGQKTHDAVPRVRMYACIGLAGMGKGASPYAQDLHRLLIDEEPRVRRCAIEALGGVSPEDVAGFIHEIADHLHDMDAEVRQATVGATKVLHPEVFIGAEEASKLADPDPVVRRAGAYALSFMGQAATYHLEALAAHLDDPDKDVREGADMALKKLGALGFVWTGVPRTFNFYNNIDGSKFAGTKTWQDIVTVSEKDLLMIASGQRGKEIAVTLGKNGQFLEVISVGGGLGARPTPSAALQQTEAAVFVGGDAQATAERVNETQHIGAQAAPSS